jgi:CheY-like chemotaxis protein
MVSLNTVRRIRQECMRDDLTIVVLTTLSTPGERERCMDAGANEYVKKPFGIRQLDTILETYLGS